MARAGGETPTEIRRESGSGQTFRGKFELDLNMTLPQLFGVISTLACPTAPIIDLESAPKVIAELISVMRSLPASSFIFVIFTKSASVFSVRLSCSGRVKTGIEFKAH